MRRTAISGTGAQDARKGIGKVRNLPFQKPRKPRHGGYDGREVTNMKQTTRMSRTTGMLEKMFRALNADFFTGEEVQEPVITVQSRPGTYGHVSTYEAWSVKGETKKELNIAADWLERPIENIAATMIHEMVHLYNMEHNVKDCSRGGTYHNKRFKAEAERRGLIIEYSDKIGWSITSPSDKLLDYILEKGWTDIQIGRIKEQVPAGNNKGNGGSDNNDEDKPNPKKSSTRKYICPKCGQTIRATKAVNILCGDCMEKMIIL